MLSEICLPKVFGNFTEATEALETIFQQNVEELAAFVEGPRFEFLFTPYLDKF